MEGPTKEDVIEAIKRQLKASKFKPTWALMRMSTWIRLSNQKRIPRKLKKRYKTIIVQDISK
jgi:hypothetical protein